LALAANSAGGGYDDGTSICVSVMAVSVVTQRGHGGAASHQIVRRCPTRG